MLKNFSKINLLQAIFLMGLMGFTLDPILAADQPAQTQKKPGMMDKMKTKLSKKPAAGAPVATGAVPGQAVPSATQKKPGMMDKMKTKFGKKPAAGAPVATGTAGVVPETAVQAGAQKKPGMMDKMKTKFSKKPAAGAPVATGTAGVVVPETSQAVPPGTAKKPGLMGRMKAGLSRKPAAGAPGTAGVPEGATGPGVPQKKSMFGSMLGGKRPGETAEQREIRIANENPAQQATRARKAEMKQQMLGAGIAAGTMGAGAVLQQRQAKAAQKQQQMELQQQQQLEQQELQQQQIDQEQQEVAEQ